MRRVTYSMAVSLDGYIAGPDGQFAWGVPDEEVFRFATDETRQVGVQLLGRKLYETILYWETADLDLSLDDSDREWIEIWKPLPKGDSNSSALEHSTATGGRTERSRHPRRLWICPA
jgi:dihydrofolate reductase